MSKAHGSPLQHKWKTSEANQDVLEGQKAKVFFQLGVITEHLSRLSFDQAGSLFEEDGEYHIKTCLSRGLLLNGRHTLENIHRGPFQYERDYYKAQVSAFIEHVKYLPLGHHCFFVPVPAPSEYEDYAQFRDASCWWSDFVTVQSKIDSSDNRADYVIAGEILSEIATKWTDDGLRNRFAIHHADLSVNNIYVDEDFNITCIIDWAFSSAVPMSMLLTAPGLPQSRHEVDAPLFSAFENGFRCSLEETTEPQGVHTESALCWMLSRSRPMWLLSRILSLDSTTDYYLFKTLWDLTKSYDQSVAEIFHLKQSSTHYISLYDELKKEDQTMERVAALENAYFRDDWRLAISRKLTLVSQWSSRYHKSQTSGIRRNGSVFVADKRLWAWINDCLKL